MATLLVSFLFDRDPTSIRKLGSFTMLDVRLGDYVLVENRNRAASTDVKVRFFLGILPEDLKHYKKCALP